MLRYLLASPKYGLLHTRDMPMRCEEHLRRTLGILSVPSAYSSLLFIRYLPESEHYPTRQREPTAGYPGKNDERVSQWGRLRAGADVVADFIVHKMRLWR